MEKLILRKLFIQQERTNFGRNKFKFIKYMKQNSLNLLKIQTHEIMEEIWQLGEDAGYIKYFLHDYKGMPSFDNLIKAAMIMPPLSPMQHT